MEEILASIRRIIEDSDNVQSDSGQPTASADESAEPAADREGSVIEVDAFRPEQRAAEAPTWQAASAKTAFSGAASGAHEGFAAEPSTAKAPETPKPAEAPKMTEIQSAARREATEAKPSRPDSARAATAPTTGSGEELSEPSLLQPKNAEPSFQGGDAASPKVEPREELLDAGDTFEDDADDGDAESDTARQRAPIISERTGRQVAAAFEELSEAFQASRRKSFDEMAEEMIRPMLQDWLDNNLPVLVERLVREEIERIARG